MMINFENRIKRKKLIVTMIGQHHIYEYKGNAYFIVRTVKAKKPLAILFPFWYRLFRLDSWEEVYLYKDILTNQQYVRECKDFHSKFVA